jgi:hypothetical protein
MTGQADLEGMPVLEPSDRIGFESPYPLAISQIGPREWELTAPLTYHGTRQRFDIPIGATTDLGSNPRVAMALVTIFEVASPALHDRLWRHWVPLTAHLPSGQRVTYRDADGLLRQALMTQGAGLLRRWIIWAGVRWGALTRPGGRQDWWRDAPLVLLISVLTLPVVLLPTPIGVGLLNLAEWVVSPLDRRKRARLYHAGHG